MSSQLNDFHKQDVTFDINRLKEACDQVLKVKGFDTSLGIPHFAGISLNQIPGDPESIKGSKIRELIFVKSHFFVDTCIKKNFSLIDKIQLLI